MQSKQGGCILDEVKGAPQNPTCSSGAIWSVGFCSAPSRSTNQNIYTYQSQENCPTNGVHRNQIKRDVSELESREFKITPAGIKSFLRWVDFMQNEFHAEYSSEDCDSLPVHFLMESTGVYSTNIEKMIYAIAPSSTIIITNPEPIKAFRTSLNIKNKTDKIDSQVIARYGIERTPKSRAKLSPELQSLRDLSRARSFLKDQRTAINNYHDNINNSLPKRMCTNISKQIDREIEGLDREIKKIVRENQGIKHEVKIMTSMPGIGLASAVAILGEMGSLKDYETREKMVAMSGLNPVRKQSGSSINMTHLSKGGSPLVRRFLYMDSKTALPKITTLQDLYNRLLAKGNTRMQARCAVMRKMLLILRGMVKNDQEFRVLNENLEKCGEIA